MMKEEIKTFLKDALYEAMMSKKHQLNEMKGDIEFIKGFLDVAFSKDKTYLSKYDLLIELKIVEKELRKKINES